MFIQPAFSLMWRLVPQLSDDTFSQNSTTASLGFQHAPRNSDTTARQFEAFADCNGQGGDKI